MKKTVGKIDMIIRLIISVIIAGAGLYYKSYFGLIALIPIGTALSGRCLLYSLLGISTCKKD